MVGVLVGTVTAKPWPVRSLWRLDVDGLSLRSACVPSVTVNVPPVALVTFGVLLLVLAVSCVPSATSCARSVVVSNSIV